MRVANIFLRAHCDIVCRINPKNGVFNLLTFWCLIIRELDKYM